MTAFFADDIMNGKEKEIRRQREPECARNLPCIGLWMEKPGFRDESHEFIRLHDKKSAEGEAADGFFSAENGANKP